MLPGRSRGAWKHWHSLLWVFALALAPATARGTPYDYIPVGDPIESELRILDLFDSAPLHNRIRLPTSRPDRSRSSSSRGSGPPQSSPDLIRGISLARIERTLGRDRSPLFSPHYLYTSTPRLFESGSEKTLLEISLGAEGRVLHDEDDWTAASGSGLHGRLALGLDRLVAFSHYVVGKFDDAQSFADPIVANTDIIVLSEETFLSYTERAWAVVDPVRTVALALGAGRRRVARPLQDRARDHRARVPRAPQRAARGRHRAQCDAPSRPRASSSPPTASSGSSPTACASASPKRRATSPRAGSRST